jgi:hypothetical protein
MFPRRQSCVAGVAAPYCAVVNMGRLRYRPVAERRLVVPKLAWISLLVAFVALPAMAETAIPDLRGTWTGESESIVRGRGNLHHRAKAADEPRFSSASFTMTIDKQDGRRFTGTWSSPRSTEKIMAVVSRNGTIYMLDDDGYSFGTLLAPNRMELCYLQQVPNARVASCAEMTKK